MRYSLRKIVKLYVIKVLTKEEKRDFEEKCIGLNKTYKFCPKGYIIVKERDVGKIVRFGYPIGIEETIHEEVDYFVRTTKNINIIKPVAFRFEFQGFGVKI